MAYNPENSVVSTVLPVDSILDGVVIEINDGVVTDFVKSETGIKAWKGDVHSPAIEAVVECLVDNKPARIKQLFVYGVGKSGETEYSLRSSIGKFKAKYGSLPKVGVKVKVITNNSGFGKIKLN